jgi:uncharacterized protein
MHNFTPISALLGGALIGLASTWLMLANGRIAGISGILGGLLRFSAGDRAWRLTFAAGLVLGPLVLRAAGWELPDISPQTGTTGLLVAGLLVGFGTRLGSGCTSGHGVCGVSRWSRRSLAATATFMLSAIVTVYLIRHAVE